MTNEFRGGEGSLLHFSYKSNFVFQVWGEMSHENELQNGGGEKTNLQAGDNEERKVREEESDEMQTWDEENEEKVSKVGV